MRGVLVRHFDRVAIISLPRQEGRRSRLKSHLKQLGLADEKAITWVDAVDGQQEKVPSWWKAGTGAWGCRQSHLEVMRNALDDGVDRLLVLEDDVVFQPRTAEWLNALMPDLPSSWDQFFLGGQHTSRPEETADSRILRAGCINRTHAYALQKKALPRVLEEMSAEEACRAHPDWHLDHHFGSQHLAKTWETYAPSWWFAGQEEGRSDIAKDGELDRRWWQEGNYYWKLPFVRISEDSLNESFLFRASAPRETTPAALAEWLLRTAQAAWQEGRLPVLPASLPRVGPLWPAGVRKIHTSLELGELIDYPTNGLFRHPFFTNL